MLMGILFILSLLTLLCIGIVLFFNEKHIHGVLLIVLLGFGVRLFCCLDPMLHKWDERYHALVSKNLIESPFEPKLYTDHVIDFDYKVWSSNKIWLHKQPVPLWSMALSLKVFGVSELSLRMPSLFISSICIYFTFLIGRNLFSPRVGFIAALFHSINGLIIELASGRVATDHIDTFFLFFIELAIVIILKYKFAKKKQKKKLLLIAIGMTLGFAILTKWLPALIVILLFIVANFKPNQSKKPLLLGSLVILIVCIFVASPWQLFTWWNFPLEYLWEQHFNHLHIFQGLEGHGQPWWFFLNRIRINVNELIYLYLIGFVIFLFKFKSDIQSGIFIGVWLLIPFVFFSSTQTKMQGYILFTFPAYFIIMAYVLNKFVIYFKGSKVVKVISLSLLILTIGLSTRYCIERVKPFNDRKFAQEVKKELTLNIKNKSVVFNVPCPIEMMFYTNCLAYEFIPKQKLINQLLKENYYLYIMYSNDVSIDLLEDSRIEVLNLPHVEEYYH